MMPPTPAYGERLRPLEHHKEIHRRPGRDETARLYFREGEIWWVRLGKNIGYETDGKSREFTRPVIILKKYNQYSFLALPLTTAPKPNPYRLPIGMVDGKQAFATLSQVRNIDSKRLVKKIVHLDADILAAIKKEASRVNFG
jgi:mRNA interferase MazF